MSEIISVQEYESQHGSLTALSHSARKTILDAEAEMKKKFENCLEQYRSKKQKIMTRSEASAHNRANDAYLIISSVVYDITSFIQFHPGGQQVLLNLAGKDATTSFEGQHLMAHFQPRL